ncbi:cupin domain-containing protein [Candidatus Protochlamydia phocaeensis]|uniref:cupin domain-containing protein n=1 Tax=Candidatus Protochlamydia phocaeensis TaxID=1414722 RepID=UPI000837D4DC|nr:cupin domain-containing protein [Candidatus Protochlamydia phocaeensis]
MKAFDNPQSVVLKAGEGPIFSTQQNTYQIKLMAAHTDGEWAFIEQTIEPGCPPPPIHLHQTFSESFYILEGKLDVFFNDQWLQAGPGTFILVPPNVYHTLANKGQERTKILIFYHPAGFENFYEEWVKLRNRYPNWPPEDKEVLKSFFEQFDVTLLPSEN